MALNRRVVLHVAWFFCLLFSCYINNGVEGSIPLSKEENDELEKQLKLLNKPAVKTIQAEYGDTYDCVDFYKQPAFDHPLLKNHTFHFQMRPSSVPNVMRDKTKFKLSLKGLGCPSGTVPIRRVTKDDLIRRKLHSDKYNSKNGSEYGVLTLDNPGTHYALARTIFDPSRKYNGAGVTITIYCPEVESSQYSSARMKIKNEPESIQAGWTVNPTLYGSYSVRLYTYFKTRQSQCFNVECPGFVIINSDIPLDAPLPVSEIGALTTYDLTVLIYRDQANGHWWLAVGNTFRYNLLGFWPHEIFTSLADLAYEIEWGGEVSGPPYIPSPPMGSSASFFKGEGEIHHDAFCQNFTTVNEAHELVDTPSLEAYKDVDTYVYRLNDMGGWTDEMNKNHLVFFGGPGGLTGN